MSSFLLNKLSGEFKLQRRSLNEESNSNLEERTKQDAREGTGTTSNRRAPALRPVLSPPGESTGQLSTFSDVLVCIMGGNFLSYLFLTRNKPRISVPQLWTVDMANTFSATEVVQLLAAKREIEKCLRAHQMDLNLIRESRAVSVEDLLKESLQIQYNCHAPNGYTIGMPLFKSHPPAPQPEEMRIGALSNYNKAVNKTERAGGAGIGNANSTRGASSLIDDLRKSISSKRHMPLSDSSDFGAEATMTPEPVQNGEMNDVGQVGGNVSNALKKARAVNISFGMSDSEDSDAE